MSALACRAAAPRSRSRAFADAIRAESAKLRTLPSVWLAVAGTLAANAALSAILAGHGASADAAALDRGLGALGWTQAGFFLIGILAAASEYAGGQMRTSLTAMPNRTAQRVASTLALGSTALCAALVTVGSGAVAALVATGARPPTLHPFDAAWVVLGAAACLTLFAVLGSALGLIVRGALPAASAVVVYLFVIDPLVTGWARFLFPAGAARVLWEATPPAGAPGGSTALVVVAGWSALFWIAALALFRGRDA